MNSFENKVTQPQPQAAPISVKILTEKCEKWTIFPYIHCFI